VPLQVLSRLNILAFEWSMLDALGAVTTFTVSLKIPSVSTHQIRLHAIAILQKMCRQGPQLSVMENLMKKKEKTWRPSKHQQCKEQEATYNSWNDRALCSPKIAETERQECPLGYEIHMYLDNHGISGDSLRAKVTSSLATKKTKY
jgi:hypothetical protein